MRETELQAWVLRHVEAGTLLSKVRNREAVTERQTATKGPRILPAFPIDYLLKQRALESAAYSLPLLEDVVPIAAMRNISPDRTSMYPDLVLFARDTQTTLIVELKTGEKTEREAITELLAYDHEVQNHLPFSSHLDICLIVIATDFGTLLDHAIASLLVWQQRRVLCLRAIHDHDDLTLEVHLPQAWTAIGQLALPPEAVQTASLAIYPEGEDVPDKLLGQAASLALELIVRDAERAGAHGFVVAWRSDVGGAPILLTIATINPLALLKHAIRNGFMKGDSDALTQWFVANAVELTETVPSVVLIGSRGRDYLSRVGSALFEGFQSWAHTWEQIRSRGTILEVEFWGVLGDFARDQFVHPFLVEERRAEIGIDNTWRNPGFAIPLVNELCGPTLFRFGRFGFSDIFKFGCRLAQMLGVCETILARGEEPLSNLPGLMQWLTLELLPAFRAIFARHSSTDMVSPRSLVMGGVHRAKESKDSLNELANWFADEFLKDNEPHQRIFLLALQTYPLMDDYFGEGLTSEEVSEASELIADQAVSLARFILENDDIGWDPNTLQTIRRDLKQLCGVDDSASTQSAIASLADALKRTQTLVASLFPQLLAMADQLLPQVVHRLGSPVGAAADWEWLRAQVNASRERGNANAGLSIAADGTIATAKFPDFVGQIATPDPEHEVLVCIEETFGIVFEVVRWDALGSGKWFAERAKKLKKWNEKPKKTKSRRSAPKT